MMTTRNNQPPISRLALIALLVSCAFFVAVIDGKDICYQYSTFTDSVRQGDFKSCSGPVGSDVVADPTAPEGSNVLRLSTSTSVDSNDASAFCQIAGAYGCNNFTLNSYVSFWMRANYEGGLFHQSLGYRAGGSFLESGFDISINGTEWKYYTFPFQGSYPGANLGSVCREFIMRPRLSNAGQMIFLDKISYHCGDSFPILSDETEPSRAQLYPAGEDQCQVITDSEGHKALKAAPTARGCYLSFVNPSFNLNAFNKSIQFSLKSNEPIRLVIQAGDVRYSRIVPSTKGVWAPVTVYIKWLASPLDLSDVTIPFAIERSARRPPQDVFVRNITYWRAKNNKVQINSF